MIRQYREANRFAAGEGFAEGVGLVAQVAARMKARGKALDVSAKVFQTYAKTVLAGVSKNPDNKAAAILYIQEAEALYAGGKTVLDELRKAAAAFAKVRTAETLTTFLEADDAAATLAVSLQGLITALALLERDPKKSKTKPDGPSAGLGD